MNIHDRNQLIEQYAAGPAELAAAWHELPAEARSWKPSARDWSAHEIVVHCADSETYAATRIRLLATEPEPLIVGYDQEEWVTALRYDLTPVDMAFPVIAAVRAHTALLLRNLAAEQWQAVGTHTQDGPFSADDWLSGYGVHLHDHAAQIRANHAAWNNHRAAQSG